MPLDVTMPDGMVIKGVPDGTTKAQLSAKYQAFNMSNPAKTSANRGALSGAWDVAKSGVSNLLATPAMHGATNIGMHIAGKDPTAANKWIDENATYHTQTPEGQKFAGAAAETIGAIAKPISEGVGKLKSAANRGIASVENPSLRNALETGADVLGNVVDTAGDVASIVPAVGAVAGTIKAGKAGMGAYEAAKAASTAKAATAATRAATPLTVVEELRAGGLKFTPNSVANVTPGKTPGFFGRVLQSSVGTNEANRIVGVENAKLFQEKAAKAIGADTSKNHGLFDEKIIENLKKPHLRVYDELARLPESPTIGSQTPYSRSIASIDTEGMSAATAPEVERLKAAYAKVGNSQKAVDDVLSLRQKAKNLIQSDNPDFEERGWAMKKIADFIDDELAARARVYGTPKLAERFTTARQELAKIHTVEDSLRAGSVDPQAILKAKKLGVPVHLDPDLSFIAKAAEYAKDVSKHMQSFAPGGNVGHAHSIVDPITGALQSAARNIAGTRILKGPYQRSLDRKGIVGSASRDLAEVPGQNYGRAPRINPMPPDEGMVSGHPNTATNKDWLALPAPGNSSWRANVRDASTMSDAERIAAARHPQSIPELGLLEGFPQAADLGGIPLHKPMVNPTKMRTENRGQKKPGPTKVRREEGPDPLSLAPGSRNRKLTVSEKRGIELAKRLEGKR